ncbi:MAG: NAD(P)-dependent oxidoreductase [Acidimicrobiia bacterium]
MTQPAPSVVLFDPVTWTGDWSYAVERVALERAGATLVIPDDRAERDAALPDADVVVVSSIDRLTAEHIGRLRRCVGILCYSAGKDTVDLTAAEDAGIPVANVQAGTADVADHAFGLLLAAWRRLPTMFEAAASGSWDLSAHPQVGSIRRLDGKTLGIFGAGAIGRAVAHRARAFGMSTIGTYRRPEKADDLLPHVPIEDLFARSDAVVLTASLTPSSEGIIDARVLGHARRGMVMVNVGRGALVVEPDLVTALDDGTISTVALDVRAQEPPDPATDRLAGRADVIQTPHWAGVSVEALEDLHRLAAETIVELLCEGGRLTR